MLEFTSSGYIFHYDQPLLWVDLLVSLVLIGFSLFLLLKILKRKFVIAYFGVAYSLLILTWFFSLRFAWAVTLLCLVVGLIVFLTANMGAVRMHVSNSLASKNAFGIQKGKDVDPIFDRRAMFRKVNDAVVSLSKQKIGAIITFERNTKLDDVIKSGTLVNAPVTAELLMTIFYPGTRLHDGAVVIRRNEIVAASVYYTPTTKPLTGKYGSRHRAAIGVSEISDSVTVVVSEETGRISIAVAGELIPTTLDNFLRIFEDYMLQEDTQLKNSEQENN